MKKLTTLTLTTLFTFATFGTTASAEWWDGGGDGVGYKTVSKSQLLKNNKKVSKKMKRKDPKAVPGDMFNKKSVPGDMFNKKDPKSVPGDMFYKK